MFKRSLVVATGLLALAACSAPPPPDYAAMYQPVVDGFVAGWDKGQVDDLGKFITDDFHRVGQGGAGNADGVPAIQKMMTGLRTSYPDARLAVDEIHYQKDLAFLRWTFTGTNTGPGDSPPTGKPVKLEGATLFRFRDGKIAEELAYFDVLSWVTQLGYTATPPAGDEMLPAAQ